MIFQQSMKKHEHPRNPQDQITSKCKQHFVLLHLGGGCLEIVKCTRVIMYGWQVKQTNHVAQTSQADKSCSADKPNRQVVWHERVKQTSHVAQTSQTDKSCSIVNCHSQIMKTERGSPPVYNVVATVLEIACLVQPASMQSPNGSPAYVDTA